ncbi:glycosyltransferase [Oenococcus sp.]|uniref:glycosyltransferase n=1 Tax=Oenococcus sp. TaxID=1979414 RepID=UPI0039EB224E
MSQTNSHHDLSDVSLSLAVVLYNNEVGTVVKLIKNLLSSTRSFNNVALFLVNNSPENVDLQNFLQDQSLHNEHIVLLTSETNSGFGAGNNLVLPFLDSDYHFVVNPDIVVPDESQIANMIVYLQAHPQVGLLSPLIKFPDGTIQHLLKKESTVFDMALRFTGLPIFKKRQRSFINLPDGYKKIHRADNVPGSFMVFRSSVFKSVKGFDEKYFLYMEDCDITRSVNTISNVTFYPDAFVYHEWQRGNRKSLKGIMTMLKSMRIYFNKWGWKLF